MTAPKISLTLEELKASYENIWSSGIMKEEEAYYRGIVDLLEVKRDGRLLDIACGAGFLLAEAVKAGLESYGLDISDEAVAHCRRTCPEAEVQQGNAEKLPFPDRFFDYVTCLGSLEHFQDPGTALAEVRRVLEDDGRACLVLPNQWALPDVLGGWVGGKNLSHGQELERFFSLNEARSLVSGDGEFWIEKERGYNSPVGIVQEAKPLGPRWERPYLWLYKRLRHRLPLALSYVFIFVVRKYPPHAPSRLVVGDPQHQPFLVAPGWHESEPGPPSSRWTKQKASAFIAADGSNQSLSFTLLDNYPERTPEELRVAVRVNDGKEIGERSLINQDWQTISLPLPAEVRGRVIKVSLEVSHTWVPQRVLGTADGRELGVAVREIWAD